MTKRCTICAHQRRVEMDYALAAGLSQRAVAARFGVSPHAVYRHQAAHLTPELRAALALKLIARQGDVHATLMEEGASIAQSLAAIRGPLFGLYLKSVDVGDIKAAATLAGRLHEGLNMTAKVTGELLPHATTNIVNVVLHPGYQALRARLIAVLARHPEARAEVAAVFRQTGEDAAALMERAAPKMIEAVATRVDNAA